MKDEKVLLVDDEDDFISALSERLETRGIKVETSANGIEALDKADETHFDAIVLDLQMPEMDGIETMKKLLKKNPDLQIILLTGHASLDKGIEAMKMGAMDFLEKPADIEKLMGQIKQAKAKRMLLTEKKMEEELSKILKTKGW